MLLVQHMLSFKNVLISCIESCEKLCCFSAMNNGSRIREGAECEEEDIRLVRNESYVWNAGEGIVQICMNGQWGYVCNDGFNRKAAQVFCRQYGILTNGKQQQNLYCGI